LDAEPLERRREQPTPTVHHQHFVAVARNGSHLARQRAHRRVVFQQGPCELDHGSHWSPVCSSMPKVRLKFCTAWPAAPFPRLSRQETITSRRAVRSSAKPMSQKLECATCPSSGSEPADHTRTIGRPA